MPYQERLKKYEESKRKYERENKNPTPQEYQRVLKSYAKKYRI